jgi:hypothetical protein
MQLSYANELCLKLYIKQLYRTAVEIRRLFQQIFVYFSHVLCDSACLINFNLRLL